MNLEKVVFGFFIVLAATLNFGFVYGDIGVPHYHHAWEFVAAFVVNIVATILKFGDRTQVGAIHLATSLGALLQFAAAALVWLFAGQRPFPRPASPARAADPDGRGVRDRHRGAGAHPGRRRRRPALAHDRVP